MAVRGFGGSNFVQAATVPVSGYPFTQLMLVRIPTGDANRFISEIRQDTSNRIRHYVATNEQLTGQNTAGGSSAFTFGGTLAESTWHPVAFVNASATARTLHLWDAIGGTRTSNTGAATNLAFPTDPSWLVAYTTNGDHPVDVAELGLVDRVLTNGEMDEWADGYRPIHTSFAADVVGYQPFVAGVNEPGSIGPNFSAVGSPTWVDHPTLLSLSSATENQRMSMGIGISI